MNGTIDSLKDYVEEFRAERGKSWASICAARSSAAEVQGRLVDKVGSFASDDLDVVVFGSLARREWTSGSDVDWTLLIDGQATPDHGRVALRIREAIGQTEFRGKRLVPPGSTGVFGNLAFSHDIIHHIGGQADTNSNTTQRILMLLEASPVRPASQLNGIGPYERVSRSILYRYLHDDTNFAASGRAESRIPRFFLNDVVRYWRTMCVDFAFKEWEQGGGKWALRNVKLRLSRKLLFVSGLLTVFSCFRNGDLSAEPQEPECYIPDLQVHLMQFVKSTPLDIVVWALRQLSLVSEVESLLDEYDAFLQQLNDETIRTLLQELPAGEVYKDLAFLELREISHRFQSALDKAFFEKGTELRDFTREYGLF